MSLLGLDRTVRAASEFAKRASAANPEGFDRQLSQIQNAVIKGLPADTPPQVLNAVRVTCAQCRDEHLPALTSARARALADGFVKTGDDRDAQAAVARARGDIAGAVRLEAEAKRFRAAAESFRPTSPGADSGKRTSGDQPPGVTPVADVRGDGGTDIRSPSEPVQTVVSRNLQDNRRPNSKEGRERDLRAAPLVSAERRAELRERARRELIDRSGLKARTREQLRNDIAVVTNPNLSAEARAAARGRIAATLRRRLVTSEVGHRAIEARKSFKTKLEAIDRVVAARGDVVTTIYEIIGDTTLAKETERLVAEVRHKAARARLKPDSHPADPAGPFARPGDRRRPIIRRHEIRDLAVGLRGVKKMSDLEFRTYLETARGHVKDGEFGQFEKVARAVRSGKVLWFEGTKRIVEDYAPHSSSEKFLRSLFEIAPISGEVISAVDAADAYDKAFTALDAGRKDLAIEHLTTAILATTGAVPLGGAAIRLGKKAGRARINAWLHGKLSDGKFAGWVKQQRDAWRARGSGRVEMTADGGNAGKVTAPQNKRAKANNSRSSSPDPDGKGPRPKESEAKIPIGTPDTPFKLPRTSTVKNHMAEAEFRKKFGNEGMIDPDRVGTIQDNINRFVRIEVDGKEVYYPLERLVEGLRTGEVNPQRLPPIRLFSRHGKIYTLDHRRLVAARLAGVPVRYKMATRKEIAKDRRKWTDSQRTGIIDIRDTE